MLLNFFSCLREYKVPVSLRELIDLLNALDKNVVFADMEGFYHVARSALVKDERWFHRFDSAFRDFFEGIKKQSITGLISEDWLSPSLIRSLSDEEKEALKKYDNLQELLDKLKDRLEKQEKRHEGGNKWIGTGGSSAFGNSGYHPEGIRIGGSSSQSKAAKVWERRQYKGLDGDSKIGIRNTQMALRRLRRFARQGKEEELDVNNTIRATARDGGLLNVQMMPPRKNIVKVLLFLDVGGSMDPHV